MLDEDKVLTEDELTDVLYELADSVLLVYKPEEGEQMNRGSSPKKPHKYKASKTIIDGYTFPSMKEAGDYIDAKRRQERGEIYDLKVHPRFGLMVNGITVGYYEADLSYFEDVLTERRDYKSHRVVQDSKGVKTPVYRLKKKLMKAIYGIDIREV